MSSEHGERIDLTDADRRAVARGELVRLGRETDPAFRRAYALGVLQQAVASGYGLRTALAQSEVIVMADSAYEALLATPSDGEGTDK